MAEQRPVSRKGRKYEQVIAGAQRVFMRDGFEGASVDEIAREAGVSKATLYSYFPDKRLLFVEAWMTECRRQAAAAEAEVPADVSAEEFLQMAARYISGFMVSDFGQRLFRLMAAEMARFPDLAREFYVSGVGQMHARMADHLRSLAELGQLMIEDCELAAEQFIQLCRAGLHDRLMLGLVADIRPEEIEKAGRSAVEMFLARYGARRAA